MAHILVIDDEPGVRAILVRTLAAEGHDVRLASGGKEGLRLVEAEPPDLVITDINMPEMDGLEIIMACQRLRPGMPVIAISGGGAFQKDMLLHDANLLGAAESIPKPFGPIELLDAVGRVLAGVADGDPGL